ncbi:MAG: sugar phosphate nucleotidyltransferase [Phycisphaerae bacterium]
MRAVILAGGKGTRLRPYTATLPKPLVPVGDRSILDIVLMQLNRAGVTRVTMAVSHLAQLIMAYFGDGGRLGLQIDYSLEDTPLSTIAPLKLIKDLPETFFVMNGDVLTDLDFGALYRDHVGHDADITVATFERDARIDFGVLHSDDRRRIVGFEEKPTYHFSVSMGVYVISRRLLDIVPEAVPFGFDDLMHACLARGRNARTYPHAGYWLDIGRPDDYEEANAKAEELMARLFPEGEPSGR